MSLTAADFPEFYRLVHGHEPFPWQARIVAQVLQERRWPDLVDVPTGLGKTSMLDVAVFVAAATAEHNGEGRLGRRRTFLVVDRRLVVDEATVHALRLAGSLSEAERGGSEGVLGALAAALRSYAPDATGELLPVTRMRGGTTWAAAWIDRPDRPGIVLGTVDQVGSRLLFRGYGVSDRRKPIDAALVGTDALLLVDEAHLATALTTTVAAAHERDRLRLPLPSLAVVRLTATAAPTKGAFTLDVAAHQGNAEAWRRLTAAKRMARLEATPRDVTKVMASVVLSLIQGHSVGTPAWRPTVLVACNTVDRARAVHREILAKTNSNRSPLEVDVELLIGRSRPIDRTGIQRRVLARFGSGRDPSSRPAVLVATQTVEVGVNLDVDGLVSESAAWDALVQRLGRVNRLGRYTTRFPSHPAAPAVVVHDGQENGPVYGAARDLAWDELSTVAPMLSGTGDVAVATDGFEPWLDVSPLHCRELSQARLADAAAGPPEVPVLQIPTLDAWVMTAPIPMNDPPVEVFLHGFDVGQPGVSLAWRDGLLIESGATDPLKKAVEVSTRAANALLGAMPVHTEEHVEVPLLAVRRWMDRKSAPSVSDTEAAIDEAPPKDRPITSSDPADGPFRVLAWRTDATGGGNGAWRWIDAAALRPGDQVVAPSELGGLDEYGWNPNERGRVADVSEVVTFAHGGKGARRPTLRLDNRAPDRLGLQGEAREQLRAAIQAASSTEDTTATRAQTLISALVAALGGLSTTHHLPEPWPPVDILLGWLASGPRLVEVVDPDLLVADGAGAHPLTLLLSGGRLPTTDPDGAVIPTPAEDAERDDEDEASSSAAPARVTLARHLGAVGQRAQQIAGALGFSRDVARTLADAARWHDLGKVESRFQAMLHGGDRFEAEIADELLAKSGLPPGDRLAWRRAQRMSGLPRGARHEAWSSALVEAHLAAGGEPYGGDVDLLLHLIASHHGHARPFLPLVADPRPHEIEATIDGASVRTPSSLMVDLNHPERFARLNARYGRWGLALLESVVRCADMTVSSEGS